MEVSYDVNHGRQGIRNSLGRVTPKKNFLLMFPP
jgi:hypothetical protein